MADQGQTPQNTTKKYLKKECLQALLERLFPGQTEFNIRLREDQWYFEAPRMVSDAEIDAARD